MIRITTSTVVTGMINLMFVRDVPVVCSVDEPMEHLCFTLTGDACATPYLTEVSVLVELMCQAHNTTVVVLNELKSSVPPVSERLSRSSQSSLLPLAELLR